MNSISPPDVIGRALTIYREHAAALIGAALVVFAIDAIATLLFDHGALIILASLVSIVASVFYQGMVVRLVDDVRDGSLDSSVGDLFKSVAPVALTLFLASIVVGIGVTVGLVLVIVPGLILLTIWAVVSPVVVIEQRGVFAALGRSRELVRGNGWSVFGLLVIVFVLLFAAGLIGGTIGAIGGDVVAVIVRWIVTVLVAPVAALAVSVLFFELRDGAAAAPGGAPIAPGGPGGPGASQL